MAIQVLLRIIFIFDGSESIPSQFYNKAVELYQSEVPNYLKFESYQIGSKISTINRQIYGGTNTYIAFENLANRIEQSKETDYLVIFISDGLKTEGEDEEKLIQRFQNIHKQKTLYLVNIAINQHYNEAFFEKMKKIVQNGKLKSDYNLLKANDLEQLKLSFNKLPKIINFIQNKMNEKSNDYIDTQEIQINRKNNEKDDLEKKNIQQEKIIKKVENEINELYKEKEEELKIEQKILDEKTKRFNTQKNKDL